VEKESHPVLNTSEEAEFDLLLKRKQLVAEGVAVLELSRPDGEELPRWTPGAHLDLVLDNGLERQYSLCGDPADRGSWRIAVLREENGRGGSAHVHNGLAEGTTVRVRGPRNHFVFEPAPRYVLVAGGIGITPLLPMAAAAAASGADWTLTYGGRSRASMAFTRELTEAYGDRVRLRPQDEFGLLDLDSLLGTPDANTLVYCCGPAPLLDAAEQRCAGWPAGALRVERFTPKEFGAPQRDLPFEVELTRSRKTLTVERGRSILDVVRESGVQVLSSCQEGTCGTCETEVLDGEVDHRDSLLSAEEQAANDTMMVCVSRAAGTKLVLAL
jgi:ferredoxin-NADP reductase